MRFHRLTLTGVGPFRDAQVIDFDAAGASGLYLIEGPTGAGKTTIIDSIVFALYGSLSGAESDATRMRSHLCALDEPTEVTLEFSIDGVHHTIRRNPSYERSAKKGGGTTLHRAAQTLEVHDDVTPSMREAKEIGVYLLQRLGLTVDQFRRLVVLPQGEFDTLLRAKPRERYDTLATLIDDGFLERVQAELKSQADLAVQQRSVASAEVERLLGVMRERAGEVTEVDEEFDPEATIAAVQDLAARAQYEAEEAAAPLEALRAAEHAARQHARDARAASDARAAIAAATAALDRDDADLDAAALSSRVGELVARRTRLEPLAAWEAAGDEREATRASLQAEAASLASAIDLARAEAAALPDRLREVEAEVAAARLAETQLPALRAEVQRLESLQALLLDHATASQEADTAKAQVDRRAQALQESRTALHSARTAHLALVRTQLDQRAAHLASLLADGQPCPVCGSPDHPSPAHDDSGELVTEDAVMAAEAAARAAEQLEAAAASAHDAAREAVAALDQQLTAMAARLDGASPAEVESQLTAARTALAETEATSAGLPELLQRVMDLTGQAEASAAALEGLIAREAAAREGVRAFAQRLEDETARYRAEVGDTGSATTLVAHLNRRLESIASLQAARAVAAGLPVDADPSAAEAEALGAESRRQAAEARHASAEQSRARLSDALTALGSYADELAQARRAREEVASQTTAALRLGAIATAARGSANQRNLTLQAYAVQRRFRSVLEAASVHLQRMSSGKYSLLLDETAAGNAQAGLGIAVLDTWSGQPRDPGTLSGGETFYASLSLALGLADVVLAESGGVTLETLFVDEGFGSLDADTLAVVLDQLDALRARGRTVGVISHVAEMKEWVHDRIEVIPSRRGGSRIRQTGA